MITPYLTLISKLRRHHALTAATPIAISIPSFPLFVAFKKEKKM